MTITQAATLNYIRPVGFWPRVIASIIDSFFVTLLMLPILIFILNDPLGLSPVGMATQLILPAIAVIGFWLARGSSPGKMAIGAIIVDADSYKKPSTKQCIIRYLGYYIALLPFALGFFWIAFDSRKQGWHDKLANTLVVFKEPTA